MEDIKTHRITIAPSTLALVFAFMVGGFFIWELRTVILILLTSVVLASFVESGARWFKRMRVPRAPAVVIIYLLTIGFFAGALFVFIPVLSDELSSVIALLPADSFVAEIAQGGILEVAKSFQGVSDPLAFIDEARKTVSDISGGLLEGAGFIFGGVLNFILIVVISFFLAIQEDGISEFLRVVTPAKHEDYVVSLWRRSQLKIGLWLKGQIVVAIIVGLLTYIGLAIVGVPYALMLGLLVAILELIPFGAILAAVPAIVIGFLAGGLGMAALVLVVYVVVQQIEGNILYPIAMKRVVGIPPHVVILALLVGGTLAGFLGIILAIPVAVVFMELFNDLEIRKALIVREEKDELGEDYE